MCALPSDNGVYAHCLQYAGNVVVYGPASPCDGDWFGGLRAHDAPAFLQALVQMSLDSVGGPAGPVLARHWRGRMGLAKDDQVPCPSCCSCPTCSHMSCMMSWPDILYSQNGASFF